MPRRRRNYSRNIRSASFHLPNAHNTSTSKLSRKESCHPAIATETISKVRPIKGPPLTVSTMASVERESCGFTTLFSERLARKKREQSERKGLLVKVPKSK